MIKTCRAINYQPSTPSNIGAGEGNGVEAEVEDDSHSEGGADEGLVVAAGKLCDRERNRQEKRFKQDEPQRSGNVKKQPEERIRFDRLFSGNEVHRAEQVEAADHCEDNSFRKYV